MSPFRTLPPAGTVIPGRVLLKGLMGALFPGGSRERLAREIERRYGVREVYLLNSGRSVLTVLLQAMKEERPDRTEVILPGYTCYSVAAAAVRVGLKVRPVDIDPHTFDYDPTQLEAVDTRNALVLITANLFGIPNDLPRLEEFCRERGIYMIDDAAQAMHARMGDRWAGTFGDAGLFSFDKGKNITTIQGGVLLLQNPELSERVRGIVNELPEPSALTSASLLVKLVLYWLFLRPWLYWVPDRSLPLGRTPWEVEYPVSLYPKRLAPIASGLLERVDGLTESRRSAGMQLEAALSGFRSGGGRTGSLTPVYLRYPWLRLEEERGDREPPVPDSKERRLGVSTFYPACLLDLAPLKPSIAPPGHDTPRARRVARNLLTLPTHGWTTAADLRQLMDLLRRNTAALTCGRRESSAASVGSGSGTADI